MNPFKRWDHSARNRIQTGTELVERHLDYMERFVRIDSRSFNVNEFEGDRLTPTDMQEILALAEEYLKEVGFPYVKINIPSPGPERTTPILMADLQTGTEKPTILMYAHLDKQPYMDNERFEKWNGVAPTKLTWNAERTRAYGRGAADDLSGVVAIGMAVDSMIQSVASDLETPLPESRSSLPFNVKVVFETEEESGSHSLIEQIIQNKDFFSDVHAVIITDVTNPDTGVPGLTTSLRGIIQLYVEVQRSGGKASMDEQTALYKMLASLIRDDHSLAVEKIIRQDVPVTQEEARGYAAIPTSIEAIRSQAGILEDVQPTVANDKVEMIIAQLRTSFVNCRPGHRVAGSVVLGTAGARITLPLPEGVDATTLTQCVQTALDDLNPYRLKIQLEKSPDSTAPNFLSWDLTLQSSSKDPHSGINGGPFPIAELQLARIIDRIVTSEGNLSVPNLAEAIPDGESLAGVRVRSLDTDPEYPPRLFEEKSAKGVVEIRLAPGNDELEALEHLKQHCLAHIPLGFQLQMQEDKAGGPWMTSIEHPAFERMMQSLEVGYDHEACLYGCGGSIPFVAKLMTALGDVPPLVIGAYDPDCKMHEPGESLSMIDLLGCARSVVHFCLNTHN
jgi:acetylornithine deacetylase/succinyl-diaminopimelate desuccinylase-like protein